MSQSKASRSRASVARVEWTMKTGAGYLAKVTLETPGRRTTGYGMGWNRREAIKAALERANGSKRVKA